MSRDSLQHDYFHDIESLSTVALRQLDLRESVHAIASIIARTRNVEDVLQDLCMAIYDRFRLQSAAVGVVEDGWLRYRGFASSTQPVSGRISLPVDQPFQMASQDFAALHADSIDPAVLTESRGISGGATFPIRGNSQIYGVLSVTVPNHRRLSGEAIDALAEIADAIGAGIARSPNSPSAAVPASSAVSHQSIVRSIAARQSLTEDFREDLASIAGHLRVSSVSLLVRTADQVDIYSSRAETSARSVEELHQLFDTPAVARAIEEQTYQVIRDSDMPDSLAAIMPGVRSIAVLPLAGDGSRASVLLLENIRDEAISAEQLVDAVDISEHIELLLLRETQIASITDRGQQLALVDRITAMVARASTAQEYFDEVVRALRRTFGYYAGIGIVRDGLIKFGYVELVGDVSMPEWMEEGIPVGIGLTGSVAATGEPVVERDVSRAASYLEASPETVSEACFPIIIEQDIVGVLNIETPAGNPIGERDVEILTIVANHLSIAIGNYRLVEQERRSRRAISAIQQVSTLVAQTLDPDEALHRMVQMLAEMLKYPVISLWTSGGDVLNLAAWHGFEPETEQTAVDLGEGLHGRVLVTGMPVFLNELALAPSFRPTRDDVNSVIIVPIVCRGENAGVLAIEGTDRQPLLDHDMELLNTFAEHAGTLLANARAFKAVSQEATLDSITGVPNHRYFQERLRDAIELSHIANRPLSLLVIDIDEFKRVNDRYGHLEGDRILRELASRLASHLRGEDLLARYAGDEFVVLLPAVRDSAAFEIANRLVAQARARPFRMPAGVEEHVFLSVGIATYPDDASTADELVHHADMAMYKAKKRGKNSLVLYRDIASASVDEL